MSSFGTCGTTPSRTPSDHRTRRPLHKLLTRELRVDLRHRPAPQRVTKGPGSRAAGVAMAFKLIESAQTRWRMVNAPHLVALVRAGATFVNGKLVERPDDQDQQGGDQQAA